MKRTLSYSLALVLALCALCAPAARAQIGTTCTITGTIWQVDGVTPAAGASLTVTRADKAGKLYANTSRVYSTNSNGIVSFKVPRTIGTDTAVIHVKASFGNLAAGQILYVPSDSTATLESLVRYTANPTFVVVAVPTGGGSGDTSLNGHPRLTRIENVEGQFTAGTSDSLQQAQADAKLALNIGQGKADADSMKLAFDRLGDRADADSLAGVKTTADGAVQKADTNALHAQKFKVIDNRFGDRADADSLASVKSTADAALPKADTSALHAQKFADITTSLASKLQWTDTTGFFARYGGVTAETDPTVAARIKDSLALYNLGIMRGDSAALTKVLDMIYPRSGGSSGLTNWEDPDTSATQASRTLQPKAYTANVNAVIRPLGTGAFILGPPPDGTATGGNARGTSAVDLQLYRTSATAIASGNQSFVAGSNNTASGATSICVGGDQNQATAFRSVSIGGYGNVASGSESGIYSSNSSTASIASGIVIGGTKATALHETGVVLGSRVGGYQALLATGKFQTMIIQVSDTTHNTASDTLTIGARDNWGSYALGSGGYPTNKTRFLNIDSGFVWTYSALVSARSDVGDAASFKIEGGIKRVGATTSMVGTPTITTLAADATAATWAVTAVADDTNDALHFLVTGAADKLIRWHATVTISMVGF